MHERTRRHGQKKVTSPIRASLFAPRRGDVAVPAVLAALLLLAATHVIAPAVRHVDTDTPAGSVAGWCIEQQAQLRTEEEEHAKRHRGQRGEPRRVHDAAKGQARTSRPQGQKDIVSARVHTHTKSVAAPGAPARGGLHGGVTNALGVRQHPGYAPEPGEQGLRARAADVGKRQEKADAWRGHAHTPHAAAPRGRPRAEIPYQGEGPAAGWHTEYAPEPREEGPRAVRADAGAMEQRLVRGGEGGGLRASPRRPSPTTPGYTRHGSHPDSDERPGERRYTGRASAPRGQGLRERTADAEAQMGAWRQQAQPTAAPTTGRDPTTTLSLGDAAAQAQSVVGRDTGRDGGTHRREWEHGGRRGHVLVAGRGKTGTASGRGPRLEPRPPGTQWTERGVEGRQDRSWASRPDSLDSPPKRVVSGPATETQH